MRGLRKTALWLGLIGSVSLLPLAALAEDAGIQPDLVQTHLVHTRSTRDGDGDEARRADVFRGGLEAQGDGLRAISATVGYDTRLLKLFQTFYYTRAVSLVPSLARYADANTIA